MSGPAYERAMRRISWVNSHVPAPEVLGLMGIRAEAGDRISCPFCLEDRAMRVYPDHAHCYGCSAGYSPVWLLATHEGCPAGQAAGKLLEATGRRVPPDDARPAAPEAAGPGTLAGRALVTWCSVTDPRWERDQYDARVSVTLARCRGLLDRARSADEAAAGLVTAKKIMATVIAQGRAGGRHAAR